MLSLPELAHRLLPKRTVLFLGAGASVPSGGPTGAELAARLCQELADGKMISADLMEVASILEQKRGRRAVVETVRAALANLTPTGGMLVLPSFPWTAIYTTNFDRLVELGYRRADRALVVVRSNFEYAKADVPGETVLFKLHGCCSSDIIDGHNARLVLTERDYDEYSSFRQVLFKRLELDLATKDVLVIGHSLTDKHIREYARVAADLHNKYGAGGHLYMLVYEKDEDRASLVEQRGFEIAFGGLDEFLHELTSSATVEARLPAQGGTAEQDGLLSDSLQIVTTDVSHAAKLRPDVERMFHGRPATFSDIAAQLTFRRAEETAFAQVLESAESKFLVITGVAGVGKTTLARRILMLLRDGAGGCWEHRSDFPFTTPQWLGVDERLRMLGQSGYLFVDDCTEFLGQVNKLVSALAKQEGQHGLRLVLAANHSQWLPRVKAPELFRFGTHARVTELKDPEIEDLVRLIDREARVRGLVDPAFLALNRSERIRHLRTRCSADMFVCLKNIFAFESLDTILLREYAQLSSDLQEIYRHVAALEATGGRVHRQLVLRLMSVDAGVLATYLRLLEGLVEEYDIAATDGIYGWCTRHLAVARTIARYKFSNEADLITLFERVIDGANPAVHLELKTLREICGHDFGIGALSSAETRLQLYSRMVSLVPGERVARHRIVSTLLKLGRLDAVDDAIREAERAVGIDSPLHRYKVRCRMLRAKETTGILKEDRIAILRDAERMARAGVDRFPMDKNAYSVLGEVARELTELSGQPDSLRDALASMRKASERILDPDFDTRLVELERYFRGARVEMDRGTGIDAG